MALVNTGTKSASLKRTTTTVIPANATPDVNVADTFTITVAQVSGTGTPTGSVTLQIDGGALFGGTTVTGQTLTANRTVTYSATFDDIGQPPWFWRNISKRRHPCAINRCGGRF